MLSVLMVFILLIAEKVFGYKDGNKYNGEVIK